MSAAVIGLSVLFAAGASRQQKTLLKGNMKGFQHLGIPVLDIGKARAWYVDKFGFKVVHEPKVSTAEGDIKVAFLKRDDVTLELYQLVGEGLEDIRNRGHGHIDHLAMDVGDINNGFKDATAKGAVLDEASAGGIQTIPTFWSKGVKYVIFTGPTGEKVELNQRLDGAKGKKKDNIRGWSHLGIPVKDINESRSFYRRFGFKQVMYAEIKEAGGAIKASMIEKDGFVIELYQLYGDALKEISQRKDGHIDHAAFDVVDIDKAYAELKTAGFEILEDAPVKLDFWEKGVKYFNIRGPDGEKIEFSQML